MSTFIPEPCPACPLELAENLQLRGVLWAVAGASTPAEAQRIALRFFGATDQDALAAVPDPAVEWCVCKGCFRSRCTVTDAYRGTLVSALEGVLDMMRAANMTRDQASSMWARLVCAKELADVCDALPRWIEVLRIGIDGHDALCRCDGCLSPEKKCLHLFELPTGPAREAAIRRLSAVLREAIVDARWVQRQPGHRWERLG